MFSPFAIGSALVALLAGSAVAHPASELGIAVVKEQFKNALIVPDVVPEFDPTGLFLVNYTQSIKAAFPVGQPVSLENVTQPGDSIWTLIRGTREGFEQTGSPYNDTTAKYTVIMFDANYPGSAKSDQYYLHYLENDLVYEEGPHLHHDSVLIGSNNTARVTYSPPNPPSGSGPHRYIWLVYQQTGDFVTPPTPAQSTSVGLFNFREYITASKLGKPFAGTFYTVEVGARSSNISVAQTASVDSTTLPQYTPTSSTAPPATGSTGSSNLALRAFDIGSLNLLVAGVSVLVGAALVWS